MSQTRKQRREATAKARLTAPVAAVVVGRTHDERLYSAYSQVEELEADVASLQQARTNDHVRFKTSLQAAHGKVTDAYRTGFWGGITVVTVVVVVGGALARYF